MDSFATDTYTTSSNGLDGGGGISHPRGQERDFDMDNLLDDAEEPLLEKLTRFWVDERNTPEILEWQGLVVDEVLNKLHAQVSAPRTRSLFFLIALISNSSISHHIGRNGSTPAVRSPHVRRGIFSDSSDSN